MNLWDILILLLIAAGLGFALRKVLRRKRSGGCGCGCDGCTKSCSRPTRR